MTLEIEAAGLSLRYGAVTALDDLSFKLAGGRIYGLLGRNGSGKTSLLSVLAGFRKASGGTVLVDGQPVFENPRVTRRVCLIRETGDTGDRDDRVSDALATAAHLRLGWDGDYAAALVERFQIPPRTKLGALSLGRAPPSGSPSGWPPGPPPPCSTSPTWGWTRPPGPPSPTSCWPTSWPTRARSSSPPT
jgi:ABC-2 type transport system ATP-binding protein